MRTKNSDWVVAQALAGLFSQSYTDFELIVVDSGSTDRTLDIVNEYPRRLIEIEAKSYFPGRVLNSAIEQASGEIIVFQNSDVVPLTPYSLERLVGAFDDSHVQAAYGRQATRPEAHAWVRRDYESSFPDDAERPPWITLSLPFAAMRKSIWRERGFYDDAWASEDTEWGAWATSRGHEIKYVHDALVMHSHNYTLRQLHGRRFVEGEADAFIYGRKETVLDVAKRACSATLRDWIYEARTGNWGELPITPLRRLVYHWAYFQGHRLGHTRQREGDGDSSRGQEFILARHDQ
jgi:rhamnosyltransferase